MKCECCGNEAMKKMSNLFRPSMLFYFCENCDNIVMAPPEDTEPIAAENDPQKLLSDLGEAIKQLDDSNEKAEAMADFATIEVYIASLGKIFDEPDKNKKP